MTSSEPERPPESLPPAPRRPARWTRVAWALGFVLVALGLLRAFVFGLYRVDSGSMEPWLHGDEESGELVLVRYTQNADPARFDPVVLTRPGQDDPIVKRVAGLPGESVQIVGGDLLVGGERVAPGVPRPEPVLLFDSRLEPLEAAFQLLGERWAQREDGRWFHPMRRPDETPRATYQRKVLDGRIDASGRRHAGAQEVGDLVLEVEFGVGGSAPHGHPSGYTLEITEAGDRFELIVDGDSSWADLTLLRRSSNENVEVLAEVRVEDLSMHLPMPVRFANVDNTLSVHVPGRGTLISVSYERNEPLQGGPDPSYRHLMPRASIEFEVGLFVIERVRVLRDLHYTLRGDHGVRGALQLGPDELFVLGDHSRDSLDGRDFGPVGLEQVIGVPVAVVWPPSAWRLLAPARPLAAPESP